MRCFYSFFILFFMLLPASAMAGVLASLDRNQVEEGSSVQLTISREGGDGEPVVAPLKRDFEILGRSASSSYRFINGHASSSKQWVFSLMPKRSGSLTIPALQVGNAHSQPLSSTVLAAGSSLPSSHQPQGQGANATSQSPTPRGNLFVYATVTPRNAKVQQQIILTVRLYRAINLAQAQLSEPKVAHAVVVALGKDRNSEQVVNGRRYLVTERKYAIFPQQRGRLTIPAIRFEGRTMSAGSMFDPFNQFGRVVRKFSQPISLDIAGIPASWHGSPWLPARKVSLHQTLSTGTHKAGEPITRTVEIRADGLTSAQIPPVLDGVLPDGLKRYPDQPLTNDAKSDSGVQGMRREKVAIIPIHGGNFMLPGVDVPWWNSATGRVEHATLPPQLIKVVGAPAVAPSTPQTAAPAMPSTQPSAAATATKVESGWWPLVSGVLLLLWLTTLLLWWQARQRAGSRIVATSEPSGDGERSLQLRHSWAQKVRKACESEDAVACVEALRQWQRQLPDNADIPSELHGYIEELQSLVYGSGNAWQPLALLACFDAVNHQWDGEQRAARHETELPPLY